MWLVDLRMWCEWCHILEIRREQKSGILSIPITSHLIRALILVMIMFVFGYLYLTVMRLEVF